MRATGIVAMVMTLVGCASASIPAVGLPGCDQTDEFAFRGEATLAELGFRDFVGGPEATRTGMIWVTAGPVPMDGGPSGPRGAPVEEPPLTRVMCIEWPDGSDMATSIEDDWEPPPGLLAARGQSGTPMPLLAVVVALVVVIGASILAFRADHPKET